MLLKFRGKVPYIISTWCVFADDLQINNNEVTCNTANIAINRGQWTSSEDIKTVVEWLEDKELFCNGFEKIDSFGKQIKVTYRNKDLYGEFYCSSVDIIKSFQGDIKIIARECVFNDPMTKKETEQICKITSSTNTNKTDINIENIPHLHFSEIEFEKSFEKNSDLNKNDIITNDDVLYDNLKLYIHLSECELRFKGFWKNTRTKYDREGFLVEFGTYITYSASIIFDTIHQLKDYLCKIEKDYELNIRFDENTYFDGFNTETEIVGTKGIKIIDLNSILQTNFNKSVDNDYCY